MRAPAIIGRMPSMLGRKIYTQEQLDNCKAAVDQQLAAYKTLVKAVAAATRS
jgi:hypothetical protein